MLDLAEQMEEEVSASEAEENAPDAAGLGKKRKAAAKEDGPACQSCRRKKAKCSRRHPCSHCERYNLECVYDERKLKPGIRPGAIEHLSQRIATLENMFLGQGVLWQQVWRCLDAISAQSPTDSGCSIGIDQRLQGQTLQACTAQLKKTLSSISSDAQDRPTEADSGSAPSPKRPRLDAWKEAAEPTQVLAADTSYAVDQQGDVALPDDLLASLVDIYFVRIHPWIPMLHVRQFRQRMVNPTQRKRLTAIFHAIVSLCVRFSDDPRLGDAKTRLEISRRSRDTVILQSMQSFSVENLQALIICAFDTIGSGRSPSAWSIVGSMTRTVEQLQLSVEDEDQSSATDARVLIKRIAFLPPARDWSELEERRRVFWNVFLMDRFCSIATGWNLSLTSADVKRRLPCEGALWEHGHSLDTPTPYFGVSDQTSRGNSALPSARAESEDQESLGGFAYCIEATESLSLVTSFFLQQAVDVSKPQDVQLWLMRFKQLDLRLVQWKIYLPERWREACALNPDGIMDPNLTLAHITHNTAVVLLHQGVAYPSVEWQSMPIRLPSTSSAETCLVAATEVAIIAEKFLQGSDLLTSPQFAFCLFICGRMLLAHSSYYNIRLPSELDSLVNSLWEISRRWNGPYGLPGSVASSENLASKFASRLLHARQMGASLDIRQAVYSEDQGAETTASDLTPNKPTRLLNNGGVHTASHLLESPSRTSHHQSVSRLADGATLGMDQGESPDSISLAFPPLPLAFQAQPSSANQTAMQSPILASMNQPGAMYGGDRVPEYNVQPGRMSVDGASAGFEDLSSFLDYSFLPNQRVSMFSHPVDKPPGMS